MLCQSQLLFPRDAIREREQRCIAKGGIHEASGKCIRNLGINSKTKRTLQKSSSSSSPSSQSTPSANIFSVSSSSLSSPVTRSRCFASSQACRTNSKPSFLNASNICTTAEIVDQYVKSDGKCRRNSQHLNNQYICCKLDR